MTDEVVDPHLVQLVHPDYPTVFPVVNGAYEDHTAEIIVKVIQWYQRRVPNMLVEIVLPESESTKMLAEAAEKIAEVEKIHQPWANTRWGQQRCAGCGQSWPCKTNSALYGWPDRANQANSAPAIDDSDKKP